MEKYKIQYLPQHTFSNCKYRNILPFDFYLPNYNICIEYNGEQHYKPIEYFGGVKVFEIQLIRDNIKKEYCLNNNIPLLIISYKENVEEILTNYITGVIGINGPIGSIDVCPAYKSEVPLIS